MVGEGGGARRGPDGVVGRGDGREERGRRGDVWVFEEGAEADHAGDAKGGTLFIRRGPSLLAPRLALNILAPPDNAAF